MKKVGFGDWSQWTNKLAQKTLHSFSGLNIRFVWIHIPLWSAFVSAWCIHYCSVFISYLYLRYWTVSYCLVMKRSWQFFKTNSDFTSRKLIFFLFKPPSFLFFFETKCPWIHSIAQADLKVVSVLLPQPLRGLGFRHAPPWLAPVIAVFHLGNRKRKFVHRRRYRKAS